VSWRFCRVCLFCMLGGCGFCYVVFCLWVGLLCFGCEWLCVGMCFVVLWVLGVGLGVRL